MRVCVTCDVPCVVCCVYVAHVDDDDDDVRYVDCKSSVYSCVFNYGDASFVVFRMCIVLLRSNVVFRASI